MPDSRALSKPSDQLQSIHTPVRGPQRQAAPLHAEALAAIRATAFTRRRTRGDVAQASVSD